MINKDNKYFIEYVNDMFNRWTKDGGTESEITYSFLKMIDDLMQAALERAPMPFTCKKGCSHCCYQLVGLTEPEAKLISENIECDDKHIEHIKKVAPFNTVEEWATLPHGLKRCIFLSETNECRIYEIRPFTCRTYYVVSDPKLCDMSETANDVAVLNNELVNLAYRIFIERFTSSSKEIGKLNELLLRQIPRSIQN